MKSVVLWGRGTAAACLAAALMVGIEPSVAQAAGEPSDQEAPVVVVDPVEVKGKRIENVEDVKQELARRPGQYPDRGKADHRVTGAQPARRVAVRPRRTVSVAFRRR